MRKWLLGAPLAALAAVAATDPSERFVHAHLAALRSAAAVVALRGDAPRGRARAVWDLLTRVEGFDTTGFDIEQTVAAISRRMEALSEVGHGD